MKIGEAVGYGILIFIGLGALKIFGGVKGLADMFGGIFGGNGAEYIAQQKPPEQILTETQKLEQQYEKLTPAGQELAQVKQTRAVVETALEKDVGMQYLEGMEAVSRWAPFPFSLIHPLLGYATQTIKEIPADVEQRATLDYMKAAAEQDVEIPPPVPAIPEVQYLTPELQIPTKEELLSMVPPTESLHGQAYMKDGYVFRFRGR